MADEPGLAGDPCSAYSSVGMGETPVNRPKTSILLSCAAVLLVAIVSLVAIASIARSLGSPIIWSVEIAQMLFIWLCMLAADLALQQARHFGLSLLHDAVPAHVGYWIKLANLAVIMTLLLFLLYHSFDVVRLSHPRLYGATQMHFSYITGALPFGLLLMVRTLGMELVRLLGTSPRAV